MTGITVIELLVIRSITSTISSSGQACGTRVRSRSRSVLVVRAFPGTERTFGIDTIPATIPSSTTT